MRSYCERQTHIHSARIVLHRCIKKFLDFCKCDNLIETFANFHFPHSQNRAIQENIFATGKLWMEASPDFQQTRQPSTNPYRPFCWTSDAGQNFQDRALACAIPSQDADHVTLLNVESDILQRPK